MRKLLPLIIALCLGFIQRAEAIDYCGNNVRWTLNEYGMLLLEGSGGMTNWQSPTDVPWYNQRNNIKSVYIDEGVTTIGNFAFYDCRDLHSVTMPKTMQQIGDGAFVWCTSLYTVSIPASVTSISSSAFVWCYRLMEINVAPDNANYVSTEGVLFNKNKSILIKFPENHKSHTYYIPGTVTTIGDHAFEHTCNLTSITIPSSVSSIGEMAFQGSRISTITIPTKITQINDAAFNCCKNLTAINVNGQNTKYSSVDGVLLDKAQLTLIQYPIGKTSTSYTVLDGVTTISDHAFRKSSSLTKVIVPNSVTTLKEIAYWGTNITIEGPEPAFKAGDANGDKEINILDVLATLSIMKGQPGTFKVDAADANGDGKVDILDVLKILEIMKSH